MFAVPVPIRPIICTGQKRIVKYRGFAIMRKAMARCGTATNGIVTNVQSTICVNCESDTEDTEHFGTSHGNDAARMIGELVFLFPQVPAIRGLD